MVKRRIIYIFSLACAASFYVLYPYWFSGYLFAVMVLVVPFDFIISLPGMISRRVALAAPGMLEQGAEGKLVITTHQSKPYPAMCIKFWLREKNDDNTTGRNVVCDAERGSVRELMIDTSRSGVTIFELKRISTVSLIGLFSIPVTINRRVSVLILPAPVRPPHVAALPRGVIFRPKPGGGFSEDYDLRPYRQGDQIRSIHWKISAKLDSLIVREPLVPPPHSRLVHAADWSGSGGRDLILGRLRWISDYLLKWEMPYYLKHGENGPIAEITHAEDLIDYIYRILDGSTQPLPTPASLPARFAWVFSVDARKAVV